MDMNIVCGLDQNYVQHTCVMLQSLWYHNRQHTLNVYVFYTGLTERDQSHFNFLKEKPNFSLHFIPVNDPDLSTYFRFGHVTEAVYLRVYISDLLPNTVTEALYLDSDLLVMDDIGALYQTDLSRFPIAAALDRYLPKHLLDLNLPIDGNYFNSGVMVINVSAWRNLDITSKARALIKQLGSRLKTWDQDVLNILFFNNWLEIDVRYNYRDTLRLPSKQTPIIIHFATPSKPWQYMCRHPYKHWYYYFLKDTPFASYVPPDKTLGNWFRKYHLMPAWYDMWQAARNQNNQ